MWRAKFGTYKTFIGRTTGYLGIINSAMLLFLFLSDLEDFGIDIEIKKLFAPLLIFGIIMMIFFGKVEDVLGLHEAETYAAQQRNPYMKKIIDRLDRIENKLK